LRDFKGLTSDPHSNIEWICFIN